MVIRHMEDHLIMKGAGGMESRQIGAQEKNIIRVPPRWIIGGEPETTRKKTPGECQLRGEGCMRSGV